MTRQTPSLRRAAAGLLLACAALLAVSGAAYAQSTAPDKPTGLTAMAASATQIDLSWNAPASNGGQSITDYKIEVSVDAENTWTELDSTTVSTDTNYSDTALTASCSVRLYRVSAINSIGPGAASDTAGAAPHLAPVTPAVASDETEVWSSQLTVGQHSVDNYRVGVDLESFGSLADREIEYKGKTTAVGLLYSAEGNSFFETTAALFGAAKNWKLHVGSQTLEASAAIPAGAALYIWLGTAPGWCPGDVVTVRLTTTEPGAPRSLSATAGTGTSVTLSWTAPASAGGSDITGYEYRHSIDGGQNWGDWTAIENSASLTGAAIADLEGSRTYTFQLRAANDAGSGLYSGTAQATIAAGAPAAPVNLTAWPASGAAPLQWTTPWDGGSAITKYQVRHVAGTTAAGTWTDITGSGPTTTEHRVTGLTNGTAYTVQVHAVNGNGNGAEATVTVTPKPVPDKPTGLTATAVTATQIDLSWAAPASNGGTDITDYKIEVSVDGGDTWTALDANTVSTDTNYSDTGLTASCSVRLYRVSATNSGGTGAASDTAGTAPHLAPVTPALASDETEIWSSELTVGQRVGGDGDLRVGFIASDFGSLADREVEYKGTTGLVDSVYSLRGATNFDIRPDPVGAATNWKLHVGSQAWEPSNSVLSFGRYYEWRGTIPAWCPGDVVTVRLTTTEPGAPTNLSATAGTGASVTLSWTAPASVGGSDITGYEYRHSIDGGQNWGDWTAIEDSASLTSVAIADFEVGRTYTFQLRAANAAGSGLYSATAQATIEAGAPAAPVDLTAAPADGAALLQWTTPSNGGSAITKYQVRYVAGTTPAGTWTDITGSGPTTTEHRVTGLTNGTAYTVEVHAVNVNGNGAAASVAVTPAQTTDATLSGLSLSGGTLAPAFAAAVTDYTAYVIASQVTVTPVKNYTGATVAYLDGSDTELTDADPNTAGQQVDLVIGDNTIKVQVTADDEATVRTYTIVVTRYQATKPGKPGGVFAKDATGSTTQIDLFWDPPETDGGPPVTGYRIEVSTDANTWTDLVPDTESTDTEYQHTGLTASTRRYYRVSAINAAGTGSASDTASASTAFVPTANADGSITLLEADMTVVSMAHEGGGLDSTGMGFYEIDELRYGDLHPRSFTYLGSIVRIDALQTEPTGSCKEDGGELSLWSGVGNWDDLGFVKTVLHIGSTTLAFADADEQTPSWLQWYCVDDDDIGWWDGAMLTVKIVLANEPSAATNVTARAAYASEIDLGWDAPAADGGAPITGYRIEVSTDGNTWTNLVADTESTDTEYRHTGLTAGSTRYYRVSAINTIGTGTASATASATTSTVAGSAVNADGSETLFTATLTVGQAESGSVTLQTFGYSPGGGYGSLDNTSFFISSTAYTVAALVLDATSSPSKLGLSLNPALGTKHANLGLEVGAGSFDLSDAAVAVLSGGASYEWSNPGLTWAAADEVAVKVARLHKPGAPTGLTARSTSATRIDLDWDAPAKSGGREITGYRIEVSIDDSTWTDLAADTESADTEYRHTGLAAGTTRHYRVSAINAIGTGSASDAASATTPAVGVFVPTENADGSTTVLEADMTVVSMAHGGGSLDSDGMGYYEYSGEKYGDLDPRSFIYEGSTSRIFALQTEPGGSCAGDTSKGELTLMDELGNWRAVGYVKPVLHIGSTTFAFADADEQVGALMNWYCVDDDDVGWSDGAMLTVKIVLVNEPSAPRNLTATVASATEVGLGWAAPAQTGGADITGYEYRHSTDGGDNWGAWTAIASSASLTSYTVSGLDTTSTYTFQLQAVNSSGAGVHADANAASTDASLSGLSLSAGTLTPAFAAATTGYAATVANTVSRVTVTPGRNHTGATVAYLDGSDAALTDADPNTDHQQVDLVIGPNTIKVKVTAEDGTTMQTYTVVVTRTDAPPVFTSAATASVVENATAVLTVAASDADSQDSVNGYSLAGGADAGLFTLNGSTGALSFTAAPNFEDAQDADGNNAYLVTVRATSGSGTRLLTADQTITVTVTDDDTEAPAAPAAPTVAPGSDSTRLDVTWNAPANAGPAITDYDVQYRQGSNGAFTPRTHTGTATSTTITGLTAETGYQVQVKARNAEGDSAWSPAGAGTTSQAPNGPPAFTSAATASVVENTTAVLTVAASDSDSQDSVTGYSLAGGADAGLFTLNGSTGALSFTAAPNFENAQDAASSDPANAAGNNDYLVTVRATSGSGDRVLTADQTITVTVTDDDSEKPATPAAPTVTPGSDATSLSVAWSAPANGGPAIDDYDVQYRQGTSGAFTAWTHTGDTTSTTITGLTAQTDYEVQVRARSPEGDSDWSSAGTGTTSQAPNAVPAFTSAATASVVENTTAAVLTVAASDSDTQDSVTGYEVTGGADAGRFTLDGSTGALSFAAPPDFENAQDADADNVYQVIVRATGGSGDRLRTADQTIAVTVTDDDSEAPAAPAAPTVAPGSDATSLDVTWDEPDNAGPAISGYDVRYRQGSSGAFTARAHADATTGTTITGLTAQTGYEVQVKARNPEGESAWSPSGAGTTAPPPNLPPAFTSTDAVSIAENTTAVLTVAASDPDSQDSVTGYALAGGADAARFTLDGSSGELQFATPRNFESPSDADGDNVYQVIVRAISGSDDRLRTVEQTIAVTVTDDEAEAPAAPAAPAVRPGSSSSRLSVSWSAPANTGSPITDYDVRYRQGSSGTFTAWPHAGDATRTTITGLTADTGYQVQVKARNPEGDSPWSPSGTGTTARSKAIVENGDRTMFMPQHVDGSEQLSVGGVTVTVEVTNGAAPDGLTLILPSSALRQGATITFTVTSEGTPDPPAGFRVGTLTVDIELTGIDLDGTMATVCLPAAADEPATMYRYDAEAGVWTELSSTVKTVDGVRCVCATTDHFSLFTLLQGPPSLPAPRDLRVRAGDSSRAELSWVAPPIGRDNLALQGYRVELCTAPCDAEPDWEVLIADTGSTRTAWTHEGLAPGAIRRHRYRVRAIDTMGQAGAPSNVAELPPTEVSGLQATAIDPTTIRLRFVVAYPDGNDLLVRYRTVGDPGTGDVARIPLTHKGEVIFLLEGLQPDTAYEITLDFVDSFDSERAQTIRATTPAVDPVAKAWLARFGRTAAGHVLDAVAERLHARGPAPSQATIAGRRLRRTADTADADRWYARLLEGGVSDQMRTLPFHQLLAGSSFHLAGAATGAGDQPDGGGRWSVWGRGAWSRFAGADGGLDLDGEVLSITAGADYEQDRLLGGLALSYSTGAGSYDHSSRRDSGELRSTLLGVHPYLRIALHDGLAVWGLLGYAPVGTLSLERGDRGAVDTGAAMIMGAVGARGTLLQAAHAGGFELAAAADGLLLRMRSEAAPELVATVAEVRRLRLLLNASWSALPVLGGVLTPALEVGARNDSGDAETGSGLLVGGSLSYALPAWGLTLSAAGQGLLLHEADGFSEWGAGGSLSFDPGAPGRGLALRVTPSWGTATAGGGAGLWSLPDASGLAAASHFDPAPRLDAALNYGLDVPGAMDGLLTSYAGVALAGGGERTWRVGSRLSVDPGFSLSLEGVRTEARAAIDHSLTLTAFVRQAARRRPHMAKPKSVASRSVEVKSSSVISPPPWTPRSITVSSPSWVIVRSGNPDIEENAERSIMSSPSVKSVIVSLPSPAANTKVSSPLPPVIVSSPVPPVMVSSPESPAIRSSPAPPFRMSSPSWPSMTSVSAPPSMVSFPSPPTSQSLPAPP